MARGLGQALRTWRGRRGLTQRDLAKRVAVSPAYIAQLELGIRRNPSLAIVKRLARALGVEVMELLR